MLYFLKLLSMQDFTDLIGHVETTNTLSCATVTVTPQNSFPKTIVIDFGTGGVLVLMEFHAKERSISHFLILA